MHDKITKQNNRDLGVVYTPVGVSVSLAKRALQVCPKQPLRILEPSVGDGSFLRAILQSSDAQHTITAVDVDGCVIEKNRATFGVSFSNTSNFVKQNFLDYMLENASSSFDLVLGNPPFIRKHNYSDELKASIEKLSAVTGYDKKHIKNAWAAFIVAAYELLSTNGVLAFVVPYELVNVDYGSVLQNEIFAKFARVDIFLPSERAFETIEQDAVAFVAQKKSAEPAGLYVHGVETLSAISDSEVKSKSTINISESNYPALDSKSFLLTSDELTLLAKLKTSVPRMSDFCQTAPGIVTGANDFFILTEEDVRKFELEEWCLPILKKGSYMPHQPVLTKKMMEKIRCNFPAHMLKIPDAPLEGLPMPLQTYLVMKATEDVSLRYKCRKRKNWFSVPIVEARPAFFFKRSYKYPRLVLNQSKALTTDTAYGIAPVKGVASKSICFSFYNTMTLAFSEIEGRFYGGGVLELTPREFRSLPLSLHKPTKADFDEFRHLHDRGGDITSDVSVFGDRMLANDLSLSTFEVGLLQSSWEKLRNHRLRHGRRTVK